MIKNIEKWTQYGLFFNVYGCKVGSLSQPFICRDYWNRKETQYISV